MDNGKFNYKIDFNLNTSYVKVQCYKNIKGGRHKINLNTSYVKVQ